MRKIIVMALILINTYVLILVNISYYIIVISRLGFKIGFFILSQIEKSRKFQNRGSGSVFENPEKISSEKSRNPRDRDKFFRDIPVISRSGGPFDILKILSFYDFLAIGIFPGSSENPREFWRIPGITNFYQSRNFYPRDSGFFLISGFLSPGFSRNPLDSGFYLQDIPGIFYPDSYPLNSDFFSWDGILLIDNNLQQKIENLGSLYLLKLFYSNALL